MRIRRAQAFTLVELLAAVAVLAVLASLAYPAYNQHAAKARRVEAKQALLDLAARQERFSTIYNRWASAASDLGYAGSFPLAIGGASGVYTLSLSVDNTLGSYTATAAPTPASAQASDACGSFRIDHQGVQGVTGTAAKCW